MSRPNPRQYQQVPSREHSTPCTAPFTPPSTSSHTLHELLRPNGSHPYFVRVEKHVHEEQEEDFDMPRIARARGSWLKRNYTKRVLLFIVVSAFALLLVMHSARSTVGASLSNKMGISKPEDDILIITKAGSATIHKRLMVHLYESPRSNNYQPNRLYVSDYPLKLGDVEVFDATANMSSRVRANREFQEFRKELHGLIESSQSLGNTRDKEAGWKLDKFKFLPMMAEGYRRHPNMRWYVVVEADTFLFWNNLVKWLQTKDPSQQLMFGHSTFVDFDGQSTMFTHGGSGFVLSQALMKATFGSSPEYEHQHDDRLFETAYGDAWLSKSIYDTPGVTIKELSPSGELFRDEPPREQKFEENNWCTPIMTFHHVQPSDTSRLYDFQRRIEKVLSKKDMIMYADIWDEFMPGFLREAMRRAEKEGLPTLEEKDTEGEIGVLGWEGIKEWDGDTTDVDVADAQACEKECHNDNDCLMWSWKRYNSDQIKEDHGRKDKGKCRYTSRFFRIGVIQQERDIATGWMMRRIGDWRSKQKCSGRTGLKYD